jgi:hypothetical protein
MLNQVVLIGRAQFVSANSILLLVGEDTIRLTHALDVKNLTVNDLVAVKATLKVTDQIEVHVERLSTLKGDPNDIK